MKPFLHRCAREIRSLGLLLLLCVIRSSLRTVGYKRTLSAAAHAAGALSSFSFVQRDVSSIRDMLSAACRRWQRPGWSCVERTVLAVYLVRLQGLSPLVVTGVRRGSDSMLGHCWVDVDGQVIDSDPTEEYLVIHVEGPGKL